MTVSEMLEPEPLLHDAFNSHNTQQR